MTITTGNRDMGRHPCGLIDSGSDGDRGECRKWIGRPGLSVRGSCARVRVGSREGYTLAIGRYGKGKVVEDRQTGARLRA